MTYSDAVTWLMEMDALHGSGFYLEDAMDDDKYEPESRARDFYVWAHGQGYDPHAFAMSIMPSFSQTIRRNAD